MPRRSTKSTSIWAVLLGRCAEIPGYRVAATAQDGTRAGQKMREVMRTLEAAGFEDSGLGILEWSNGREAIQFANGSRFWTVKPAASAFRSEAADALLFDEAGELDAAKSEDLMSGALPLTDTRPLGQAIIAGTPAESRAGMFWDMLTEARQGSGTGIVDYSIRDSESSVLVDDEGNISLNEDVLRRVHPGIGTLTTMSKMRKRFGQMGLPQFEREYLCRFPRTARNAALDVDEWAAAGVPEAQWPERPERMGLAFDVDPNGASASVVGAWRDSDGVAHVEMLGHLPGTNWVAARAYEHWKTRTRYAIAYDGIGANADPANQLGKWTRPTPKLHRLTTTDVLAAAQRFASELHEGRVKWLETQSDLDAAAGNASWRDVGKSGRAFGRIDTTASGAPINPLVAASLALWEYDQTRERKKSTLV
jgi:hypothetical protein